MVEPYLSPSASPPAGRPLVLLVEDEPFLRQAFRDALEGAGFAVAEAASGEEALDLFCRLGPELVVLDLVLPGIDGFAVCAAVRGLEEGRHTPVLVLTGLQDTESIHRAFEAGATDFATKPLRSELLGYRLHYLLRASRAASRLHQSEDRLQLLRSAVECLPMGITISDADGRIVYTNPAEAQMHGYAVEELLQREARSLAPPERRQPLPAQRLQSMGLWRRESVNLRRSGETFPVQLSSIAVRNPAGTFLGTVTACEDITERKHYEEKIQHLAYFDHLTGLPNRWLFQDRLHKALALSGREKRQVGVLFLDLDQFKEVNDTQGHDFGDRLLQAVARRLLHCTREADTLARLGGDEFVVLLTTLPGQESLDSAARRILDAFQEPFEVDGRRVFIGTSIGIALYPADAGNADDLLKSADAAMYHAKAQGRQAYCFFSPEMNERIVRKVALESALRLALEQEELSLHFQPQWELASGQMLGIEALVRWQSPQLGAVPPASFIPLAESSGLIFRLGEWVLRRTCAQLRVWREAGLPVPRAAVNISGRQLRQPGLLELLDGVLAEAGLPPSCLELEFTESILMEEAERTIALLAALRKRGFSLSIDDFGTGYSSLSYLKHFPVDRVKIDRSFLVDIPRSAEDAAIVAAIVSLVHGLGMKVVAEGVENPAQAEFLSACGCDVAQGNLLSAPLAAETLAALLAAAPGGGDGRRLSGGASPQGGL